VGSLAAKQRGCSIRIFLVDGTPDGVRTIDKSNWTGRGIVCPRSRFPDAKLRPEFDRTGVYVLVGPPADAGDSPTLYIGECDPLRPRLEQHYGRKDFWTHVIAFTSKDENLNKAHVQYLESRLIGMARDVKRSNLENATSPAAPSLSEADVAEMEAFLDEMLIIFPVLGLDAFEKPELDVRPRQRLTIKSKGVTAHGYESDAGFVVLTGSEMFAETVPSIQQSPYLVTLRQSLVRKGIVVKENGTFRFSQDYTFDSPSTAAGVVLGRTANGRIEWKNEAGRTLKELQTGEVAAKAAAK
jgi:hypothetical protein